MSKFRPSINSNEFETQLDAASAASTTAAASIELSPLTVAADDDDSLGIESFFCTESKFNYLPPLEQNHLLRKYILVLVLD